MTPPLKRDLRNWVMEMKCLYWEVTHNTSTDISMVKASHTAISNFMQVRQYNLSYAWKVDSITKLDIAESTTHTYPRPIQWIFFLGITWKVFLHHLLFSVSLDVFHPSDLCRYVCLNSSLSNGYNTWPSVPSAGNMISALDHEKCHRNTL